MPTRDAMIERVWQAIRDTGEPEVLMDLATAAVDELAADKMLEALEPFADFADSPAFDKLPDDFQMSPGSPLARKQITAKDFKRALAAAKAGRGET